MTDKDDTQLRLWLEWADDTTQIIETAHESARIEDMGAHDVDLWFKTAANVMGSSLAEFTLKFYGEPCPDHDDDCPTCRAWDVVNNFRELNEVQK